MNIISNPPEYTKPKNVGLMFFSLEPERFFPYTQIDVVQFPGGLGGNDIIEQTFKGPIQQQLREALLYIRNTIITEKIVKYPERAEADRYFNYPFAAIEEALSNAVYYRAYDEREPIEVRVENDRIEIVSFPGPDRSITIEGLKNYRVSNRRYRNRRIGDFLKELHLTEGRNTGFKKILDALEANGSPKPEFETDHIPVDENHEKITFHDGFSDDYVFDEEKVYPRLKLNLAEKPADSIKIMLNDNHFKDNENERTQDNLVMVSFFEQRYIGIFIQDVGSTYKVLTYDDLPKEYEVARLQQKAFENLCRDVKYQVVESSIESGIYGLIAGGNFEAEGICLEIWENISEKLNDNILIAIPTKDLVIFVPAGNKKLVKKMINMARNTLYHNLQTDPEMVFTHDVFLYDRDKKKIEISEKYKVQQR